MPVLSQEKREGWDKRVHKPKTIVMFLRFSETPSCCNASERHTVIQWEGMMSSAGTPVSTQALASAQKLAGSNRVSHTNESAEYREARNALLAEEIELRRHIERVAAQRRALPAGGEVPQDFELVSESGPTRLSTLFGEKDALLIYSMMFGPQRERACPMCTNMLGAWDGNARDIEQNVSLVVVARSPIEKLL